MRNITSCGVCGQNSLELLWNLPKLPLTEKYGTYQPDHSLHRDQQLLFCNHCSHVQLGSQLSPQWLYSPSEYSFRTSQSRTAKEGSDLFFRFFDSIKGDRTFNSLLDIGGNDLYLAKMAEVSERCVVDPVCAAEDGRVIDNVRILGKFIEEVDFQKEALQPDLIFCRHVLEHIAEPRKLLAQLMEKCHPEAVYVFEIPCFESLVEASRFDAIFHQHYHYFDLAAFRRLLSEVNGEYLSHLHNYQGSCGGSLLIAFRRSEAPVKDTSSVDTGEKKKHIQRAIENYIHQMELISWQLQKFRKNIYGYGASLMLATLAYHLKTDLSELTCIYDDDPQKHGLGYQNLPVRICYPADSPIEPNSNFIITSLENIRILYQRIAGLTPRRIILPLIH